MAKSNRPYLCGKADLRADEKGRLVFPKKWYEQIAESKRSPPLYVYLSCPQRYFPFIRVDIEGKAEAQAVRMDPKRKFTIGKTYRDHIGVEPPCDIVMTGANDHLRIWKPETLEKLHETVPRMPGELEKELRAILGGYEQHLPNNLPDKS